MKTIRGPGIFLAQFAGDAAPFNSLKGIAGWAAGLGFTGVQIPTWDRRLFDLKLAAESRSYCDEVAGAVGQSGLAITELSTHLQGQLVASNAAYAVLFQDFAPQEFAEDLKGRQAWAVEELRSAAKASQRLGLKAHATFSGALAWPYFYPWPHRPAGLIDEAFEELGRRWLPILRAFDEVGVDVCFELHPGEDLHDGATFERFLDVVGGHDRANILYDPSHMILQQMDYLAFLDLYHQRVRAFHVKDAEFLRNDRSGVYGGYQDWLDRAGRFRSPGDGQIDFGGIFSRLTRHGYDGWACLEWECCLKNRLDGAREGAAFIARHIIHVTEHAFDAPMRGIHDAAANARLLGLGRDD